MDKVKVLSIVNSSYKLYENFLEDREFYFIYFEDRKINHTKILFEKSNFLHLTGIETKLSQNEFVKMLRRGKINESHFQIKKDGTTKLKLDVLPKLHLLPTLPTTIGVYNGFLKINLQSDYVIGDNKKILALGLKEIHENTCVPKSLLNQTTQKLDEIIGKPNRVVMVLKRNKGSLDGFEITYRSKNLTEDESKKIDTEIDIINEMCRK